MHSPSKIVLFKQNFSSGLVVFLVALPLCLGIALASGAPPLAGVLSGIVGGIVIGLLSQSHISVSGPAAGLSAIVLASITELGSFELFLCAGLIAGIFQFILGLIKSGSITNYIPFSVIEGMLAGIGIIIILKELPYAFGGGELSVILSEPILSIHLGSLIIASISLLIVISWEYSSYLKRLKLLPSALVAVIVGTIINQLFIYFDSALVIPSDQLVQLPVTENLEDAESLIHFPNFLSSAP